MRNFGIVVEVGSGAISGVSSSSRAAGVAASLALRAGRGVSGGGVRGVEGFLALGKGGPSAVPVSPGVLLAWHVSMLGGEVKSLGDVALGTCSSTLGELLGSAGSRMLDVFVRGAGSPTSGTSRSGVGLEVVEGAFETGGSLTEGEMVAAVSLAKSDNSPSEAFDRLRVMMVVRCRLLWWSPKKVEDPSLMSDSSGSVYTAFTGLYFPAAVRFIVVAVCLEVDPGWREGREGTVVATASVVVSDLRPKGLDGWPTVSGGDSLQGHIRLVED